MSVTFAIENHSERVPQFEMNLANGNAIALLRFLEIKVDYSGSISPDSLLVALAFRSPHADLLVREDTVERSVRVDRHGISQGSTVIHHGRTKDQVNRYLETLARIAYEARRQGRKVVWM